MDISFQQTDTQKAIAYFTEKLDKVSSEDIIFYKTAINDMVSIERMREEIAKSNIKI